MSFTKSFLSECVDILGKLDCGKIDALIDELVALRSRAGRLFILGVGGSAANASHLVNDLRKITGIESYAPTDNVAELTARTNDGGWDSTFIEWLITSRLSVDDALLVLSVSGGAVERNISPNLTRALMYGRDVGARLLAIVGRSDGTAAAISHCVIVVPAVNELNVTPHCETMQLLLGHLVVNHPKLRCGA